MELLIFTCASCGGPGSACPECVNTMAVDPQTGLPPDVRIVHGNAVHTDPSEDITAAQRRSEQQPICDRCVARAIAAGKPDLMTAAERHERQHHDDDSYYV